MYFLRFIPFFRTVFLARYIFFDNVFLICHCISIKLRSSYPIRIENFFHVDILTKSHINKLQLCVICTLRRISIEKKAIPINNQKYGQKKQPTTKTHLCLTSSQDLHILCQPILDILFFELLGDQTKHLTTAWISSKEHCQIH